MQLVWSTWHRLVIILFAIFGLYATNFLIVPNLPNFQQWLLPSLTTFSQQLPNNIITCTTHGATAASNCTLLPNNKTAELQDFKDNIKDEQLLLAEELPTANVEGKRDRRRRNKKGPIMQEDDEQLLLVGHGEDEELDASTSDDDQGFPIEQTGGWLALEERMDKDPRTELKLDTANEKHMEGAGHMARIFGIGIPSAEATTTKTLPIGHFEVDSALWLPDVLAWLAKCPSSTPIKILEYFGNSLCTRSCSGHGVCNHQLGECRCYHGYTGAACDVEAQVECNMKRTRDSDGHYGPWIPSMCSGTCDKRTGFCYCGADTKYPKRPVAEQCGFPKIEGTDWLFNWTTRDPKVFVASSPGPGWCNVDPDDFKAKRVHKKKDCYCIYDGTSGELCEIPTQSSCINQCSGNGFCQGGFCACAEGWHDIDCSIPSRTASGKTWPTWLSNHIVNISDSPAGSRHQESTKVTVERQRPLVYIYDLPPAFNSILMEGRHFKLQCTTRIYDAENSTIWTDQLYGAENALLESLLASKHRTTNAAEADFFYVPVLGACATARAGDAPHMDKEERYLGLRPYFAGDMYKKAYEHIKTKYPYWDRSGGRDHIWMFAWDEGACVSPKEIWSSMMLVHWGNTNSKYSHSTTQYPPDKWDLVPKHWRGNHACYDPEKDLVLPSWKHPDPNLLQLQLWTRGIEHRPTLFYFRGNLGNKYDKGRPESGYSMGIRQRIGTEFGTEPNLEGHSGRQSSPDVKVFGTHADDYSRELASSRFCGVFPGDGWSGRMEDSILHGCIPVIIQDGIHLPYENVLDYRKFAVRIAEDDLPKMVDILRSIPEKKVEMMQSTIQSLWQRFTYHNSIQLEADRQELIGKSQKGGDFHPPTWMTENKKLTQDDAFATFIQVLFYKLLQRQGQRTAKYTQSASDLHCHNHSRHQ